MIPKELKPLVTAAAVIGTVSSAEFVLLVVAEIQDGNPWSAATRLVGLVVMAGVGWWTWRQFKGMREQFAPKPTGTDGIIVHDMSECADCGVPMLTRPGEAEERCLRCWRIRVDNFLDRLEAP